MILSREPLIRCPYDFPQRSLRTAAVAPSTIPTGMIHLSTACAAHTQTDPDGAHSQRRMCMHCSEGQSQQHAPIVVRKGRTKPATRISNPMSGICQQVRRRQLAGNLRVGPAPHRATAQMRLQSSWFSPGTLNPKDSPRPRRCQHPRDIHEPGGVLRRSPLTEPA